MTFVVRSVRFVLRERAIFPCFALFNHVRANRFLMARFFTYVRRIVVTRRKGLRIPHGIVNGTRHAYLSKFAHGSGRAINDLQAMRYHNQDILRRHSNLRLVRVRIVRILRNSFHSIRSGNKLIRNLSFVKRQARATRRWFQRVIKVKAHANILRRQRAKYRNQGN